MLIRSGVRVCVGWSMGDGGLRADVSPLAIQAPPAEELMVVVFRGEVRKIRFFKFSAFEFIGITRQISKILHKSRNILTTAEKAVLIPLVKIYMQVARRRVACSIQQRVTRWDPSRWGESAGISLCLHVILTTARHLRGSEKLSTIHTPVEGTYYGKHEISSPTTYHHERKNKKRQVLTQSS